MIAFEELPVTSGAIHAGGILQLLQPNAALKASTYSRSVSGSSSATL